MSSVRAESSSAWVAVLSSELEGASHVASVPAVSPESTDKEESESGKACSEATGFKVWPLGQQLQP